MRNYFSYMLVPRELSSLLSSSSNSSQTPRSIGLQGKAFSNDYSGAWECFIFFWWAQSWSHSCLPLSALSVLRQEGTSWQLGERGPSTLCSFVTELLWIHLVLKRGLTIHFLYSQTDNQSTITVARHQYDSNLPILWEKIPQREALDARIICILNSNNVLHFLFHFWLADVSVF